MTGYLRLGADKVDPEIEMLSRLSPAAANMIGAATRQMIEKFVAAEAKHGWNDKWRWCSETEWRADFEAHVKKGDPRDLMIYCAIALARGWRTA